MSGWNYRVVHRDLGDEQEYVVREIHYGEEPDEVKLWSAEPVAPSGSSLVALTLDIQRVLAATEEPVLEYDDLPSEGEAT